MLKFQHNDKNMKNCILFKDLSEEQLKAILTCFQPKIKQYDKNELILDEYSTIYAIGVVLSGRIQLEQIDVYGNRHIVNVLGKNELLLESFVCANVSKIPMKIIALQPSEIMFIDYHHLMNPCEIGCSFLNQIMQNLVFILANKNLNFHRKLQIISKKTTKDKLLAYLNMEVIKQNSLKILIPYDRKQLADYLGVDRSGLSQEISKLVKTNKLKTDKNYFELIKEED